MIRLNITDPNDDELSIPVRRNFVVQGTINGRVPEDAKLKVELFNDNDVLVRFVHTEIKNNKNIYTRHHYLTKCPRQEDPNDEKLINFGFPELIVKDLDKPLESLRDATIKCFFNNDCFKAIIVSASDILHGLEFGDGLSYCDENGNPYDYLQEGDYVIKVTLSNSSNKELASTFKRIKIETIKEAIIYRYSPKAHRLRMQEWGKTNGYFMESNLVCGYLDQYTDDWHYHMGLLKMYRANDIATYIHAKAHMFVYLIEEDSTSYKCELAYYQKNNLVSNPDKFVAYHYDIGEAKLKRTDGMIIEFKDNLEIYRIDEVNELAKENYFNLNEESLIDTHFIDYQVHTNRIAITGVLKPLQLDQSHFSLTYDNTYSITNKPAKIIYTIDDGKTIKKEERTLGLERYLNKSLGSSLYEFYNIFEIESDINVSINVLDEYGKELDYHTEFKIHFTNNEAPITPGSDNEAL